MNKLSNKELIDKILANLDKVHNIKVLEKIFYALEPRMYLPPRYGGIHLYYKYMDIEGEIKNGTIGVYPETPIYEAINFIGDKHGYEYPEWSGAVAKASGVHFASVFHIKEDMEIILNMSADKYRKSGYRTILYIGDGQPNMYNSRGAYIKG